jgi:predicted nucleotidyltransferase
VNQRTRSQASEAIIHRLRATSAQHPGLEMMVLFGSVARGEEAPESDVDLIIDGPLTEDLTARTLLRGRLIEELGRSVELMSVDEAGRAPVVLVAALRDGHVIIDRSGRWPALLRHREQFEAEAREEQMTYPGRKRAALARLAEARRA